MLSYSRKKKLKGIKNRIGDKPMRFIFFIPLFGDCERLRLECFSLWWWVFRPADLVRLVSFHSFSTMFLQILCT
jgi:hypothetical protein